MGIRASLSEPHHVICQAWLSRCDDMGMSGCQWKQVTWCFFDDVTADKIMIEVLKYLAIVYVQILLNYRPDGHYFILKKDNDSFVEELSKLYFDLSFRSVF